MPRVFVSAPLPGDAVERLGRIAEVTVGEDHVGIRGEAFAREAGTYDAMITLLTDRVDASLLARSPLVRVVANVAVGIDNVDLSACRARGVVVTNTPGVLTEATADLAFGLVLAASRRIVEGDRLLRRGGFRGWTPTFLLGGRVHGATLGIVGLGRIGQAMARRARGFGMHVLYANEARLPVELERALGATFAPLDDLFERSDVVSLHCPLTPATRHLVSRERLGRMKAGSILVNTARGACVDEVALADALEAGPLAAAALDVFEDEPAIHPRLLARENVVLTPHIGSADRPAREGMASIATDNVIAVLEGRSPLTPV